MDAEQPGGSRSSRLLRALGIVLLALVVLAVLFLWVFPWVEAYLEDPTLGTLVSAAGRG